MWRPDVSPPVSYGPGLGPGQGHHKHRALAGGTADLDFPAVPAHYLGDNRQADAAARGPHGVGPAPEPLEDVRKLIVRDTHSGVGHGQPGLVAVGAGAHRDPAAGRGGLRRVPEQVGGLRLYPAAAIRSGRRVELAVERELT